MDRVSVSSSNVASVGYDASSEILEVEFLSGSTYHYYSVPAHIYNELLSASSVGSYLHRHVKNSFDCSRVE